MNINQTSPPNDTDINESNDSESQTQIPLGIGMSGESASDPFASSSTSRRIKSGSLVITFVVILAAVGLFAMRWLTKVTLASGRQSEAEKTVDSWYKERVESPQGKLGTGNLALDSNNVVHVLNDDFTDRQVPLTDVQKDPFVLYQVAGEFKPAPVGPASEETANRARDAARQKRMTDIQSALGSLRVKSILLGSDPLANLNGQIVRVGESIKTKDDTINLRVLSIDKDSLVVFAEDSQLDIKVEHTLFVRPNTK